MTFDEWLDAYYSGTQIDDVIAGMMRTAFEAGKCVAGTDSLRDKFAMAAMQGFCANRIYHHRPSWGEDIASDAYIVADAMLKERAK